MKSMVLISLGVIIVISVLFMNVQDENSNIFLHRKYDKMQMLIKMNIVNMEEVINDTKNSRIS